MEHQAGPIQLAPQGETSFDYTVALNEGRLVLVYQDKHRVMQRLIFSNAETEVLMTFLHDNQHFVYNPNERRTGE